MTSEFKKIKDNEDTRYVLETATAGATGAGAVATVPGTLGKVKKREDSILAQEAGKEKDTPKPRNFVAKNAKMGGAGKMKDKSKTIPRKEKHKKPVAEGIGGLGYDAQALITKLRRDVEEKRLQATPDAVLAAARELAGDMKFAPQLLVQQVLGKGMAEGFNGEYDDEAGMAHNNLLTSARAVMGLLKTIDDKDNLPEWVQEKIAKAEMMLVGVWDYLQSQKEMGVDPQQDANEAYGRYDRRDAYQRDYDHSVAGMDRPSNHRDDERHDLDPSEWYIVKDGKMFKVTVYPNQEQEAIARGYSPSREEAKAKADNVSEVAPPGWEKTVKAMKKHDNIDNPFALAWSMKNKGYKSHKKADGSDK